MLTFFLATLCSAVLRASDQPPGRSGANISPIPAAPPRTAADGATALTTVSLSTLLFDFNNNLVGNKMIQTAVVVKNTGTNTLTMAPAITADKSSSYSIVASKSCGTQLAAGKSCDILLRYLPTAASYPNPQTAVLKMNYTNAEPGDPDYVLILGTSAAMQAGTVSPTGNPQVALYTLKLPFPGRVKVEFGTSTAYALRTSYQTTEENNSSVSIYVAGMREKTTYHMAAFVELSNDVLWTDSDHTFQTGAVPPLVKYPVRVETTAGMHPQPGIELANPIEGLIAYDLSGNIIWTYQTPAFDLGVELNGAKPLPDGNMLVVTGPFSEAPLKGTIGANLVNEIREINLAGDTIREVSISDVNSLLATANCNECANLTLLTFHHDVTPLPNGHVLAIANTSMTLSSTTKPPLNSATPVAVLGDVIVDLDENFQPVWVWNEFNHLDVNRQPFNFPDWTHTNAVVYSPDDGNILVSIRHQNWVVKVDYRDGEGTGDILWKLGEGGDFKLVGGTDPTDWQYAQHDPGFFSPNTTGVFSLGLMDNGDDRLYPAGSTCTPQKALPASCTYSTIPVFKIDENGKTATLTFHQIIPKADYSDFGGNTEELANGDVEYDLCGIESTSLVREVTQDSSATTVWSMTLSKGNFYRAFRIPSLYAGVEW